MTFLAGPWETGPVGDKPLEAKPRRDRVSGPAVAGGTDVAVARPAELHGLVLTLWPLSSAFAPRVHRSDAPLNVRAG